MNIKNFPELNNPKDEDWLLIQENANIPAYKKIKLINLVGGGSAASTAWIIRDGSVLSFSVNSGQKILINTNSNLTIDLSSVAGIGSEIEVKRLQSTNQVLLNGILKINGYNIVSDSQVFLNYLPLTSKLIYLGSQIGWITLPSDAISIFSPLNLPTTGLQQKFYAGDLIELNDEQAIPQWTDTKSNKHATQTTISQQPIYRSGIFSSGKIASIFFDGNKILNTDLAYLVNQKYTIAIVEARTSSGGANYIIGSVGGSTNTALHIGYRANTTFTLAQFGNDIDVSVGGYTALTPAIWIVSNNSRGKEIWRNGVKIANNTNINNLSTCSGGTIGSANGSRFTGHLGLIAVYTGEKTTSEILEIFTAINATFGVY